MGTGVPQQKHSIDNFAEGYTPPGSTPLPSPHVGPKKFTALAVLGGGL